NPGSGQTGSVSERRLAAPEQDRRQGPCRGPRQTAAQRQRAGRLGAGIDPASGALVHGLRAGARGHDGHGGGCRHGPGSTRPARLAAQSCQASDAARAGDRGTDPAGLSHQIHRRQASPQPRHHQELSPAPLRQARHHHGAGNLSGLHRCHQAALGAGIQFRDRANLASGVRIRKIARAAQQKLSHRFNSRDFRQRWAIPANGKSSTHKWDSPGLLNDCKRGFVMSKNRGVVYTKPGEVQVQDIADPKFENPQGRKIEHGVILKVVSTNICGSDQHMVRGRTTAPAGMVLGHEITGEVIEKGSDVEMIALGDLVSVPFNVACGRCRTCREMNTGVCLTVNPGRAGGAYGYVDMGGWIGGQARYVMVPYADFNLLKFPNKDEALYKIMDLTMLTDILPTGFHGALTAGVKPGSTVYVAGAGPVGLAAAASAQLLGAAVIMIGDINEARLSHARNVGFVPIDLTKHDRLGEQVAAIVGEPTVNSVIDAVGFEAKGHGGGDQPAIVLNQAMEIIRPAGAIGIPGLYVTEDPGAHDEAAKTGSLSFRLGLGWSKSNSFHTGQTPVLRYNRQLMMALLNDRLPIAKIVNAKAISLEEAPKGYAEFDKGVAAKFVLD